jgi:hypothetical protein
MVRSHAAGQLDVVQALQCMVNGGDVAVHDLLAAPAVRPVDRGLDPRDRV